MTYALPADAAEFYESTFVPALFAGWARRLIEAVAPAVDETMLDVACGTGAVACASTAGRVTGLDLNPAMLAIARRKRPDLDWQLGDALELPFADGAFDVVVSQAALMFFPDRVGVLREMARVGGRLGLQVPGRLAASPGYVALTEVVARHAGPAVAAVIGAYFNVGDPALLTDLCTRAGWHIDHFTTWMSATHLPTLDTFLHAELLPVSGHVDAATHARIVADCRVVLAPYLAADGSVSAPLEVQLITARERA
ncbi:class I SAM-dependent methyltransferase [Actinoplanes solisilvae]|uniref:class I SAM-dependent methyltransferase n=1 Tax=Actinoplanes solisilvae TaxID=2486853 RepID=UPI000FDC20C4|nr:methyltransferase domain-containing protein [Actinoplanes solisilvae]